MSRSGPAYRRLGVAALIAGLSAFATSARAESATANVSVRFVDPVGITGGAPLAIASQRAPGAGAAVASGEASGYALSGSQVVSVETSDRIALRAGADGATLNGKLQATVVTAPAGEQQLIKLKASAPVAARTPGGVYQGSYSLVANFN